MHLWHTHPNSANDRKPVSGFNLGWSLLLPEKTTPGPSGAFLEFAEGRLKLSFCLAIFWSTTTRNSLHPHTFEIDSCQYSSTIYIFLHRGVMYDTTPWVLAACRPGLFATLIVAR